MTARERRRLGLDLPPIDLRTIRYSTTTRWSDDGRSIVHIASGRVYPNDGRRLWARG